MKKKILVFFVFLVFYLYLMPYTLYPIYAGHDIGTEGKYCDGSEIWLDVADGSHQYSDTDFRSLRHRIFSLLKPIWSDLCQCKNYSSRERFLLV